MMVKKMVFYISIGLFYSMGFTNEVLWDLGVVINRAEIQSTKDIFHQLQSKEKKSPIHPDKKHLHMLLYKLLLKKSGDKLKSNYLVSLIINFTYLILISPTFFMMNDGMFCKYYSVVLFIFYIFCYKIAYEKDR